MIQQGLKNSQQSGIIEESGLVLGTVRDFIDEHDMLIARVHKIRTKLHEKTGMYPPLLTGKKLREFYQRHGVTV